MKKTINLFIIVIITVSNILTFSKPASAQTGDPVFNVDASRDSVWGHEWEPNSLVTVDVHGITTDVPTDDVGNFGMGSNEDIIYGDTVTVTQGATSKSHVVTDLAVTVMDADNDTVSGTAAPGSEMDIRVDEVDNVWRRETVELDGTWSADFGNPGDEPGEESTVDLIPGSNGHSSQSDADNDRTIVWWRFPDPRFNVDPSGEEVWGNDWVPDSSLTVEVHGISTDVTTDMWGLFETHISEDIVAGDTVTVTQSAETKSHMVTALSFTMVDADTDMVSGSATPFSELDIWVGGEDATRHETVDLNGTWLADFSTPGDAPGEEGTADLEHGSNVDASQCDADRDCTYIWWRIPAPHFNVDASRDGVWGHQWDPNSLVTVEVQSVSTNVSTDEEGNFNINISEDIVIGDTVTVTQGSVSKAHEVTILAVTVVDMDTDTVFGTAESGSEVDIWVHGVDNIWRRETVEMDGTWSAEFGFPGDASNEEGTADLVPGSDGNSSQCDADNDCTFAGWHVPDPSITASVSHEEVWAYDWPDEPNGETLYYRVYDSYDPAFAEASVIAYEHFMTLIVTPWGTESGDRFLSDLDLKAGQTLIVRNRQFTGSPEPGPLVSGIQKELGISEIEVTSVNPDTDIIGGIAFVEQGPLLCANAYEASLCSGEVGFTWNADGTWTADFTGISEIKPGQWNSASQYDDDGDETHFWWNLPPWIVAELAQEDLAGDPLYPDIIRADAWTGPTVALTIDDPASPESPDYESGPVPVDEWGNYNFELGTNAPEWSGFDLEEGHIVTITDGIDTKVLVVERLTIDNIFQYNEIPPNVVEGTAYPDKHIRVSPWTSYGWWAERWVSADGAGNWVADFNQPGSGWREQWTAEFGAAAGEGGGAFAEIYDEDNDRTWSVYHDPDPRIIVVRGNDRVEVIDFPEGNEVTIEIDDPEIPGSTDYIDSGVVSRNPDRPWETLLVFELGEYKVSNESQVTASDGETTVIHEVEINFTLEVIDPESDTVSGTASAGAEIQIEIYHGYWRYPIADGSGNWMADFSIPGAEPGAEQSVDITYGTSGRAVHFDLEGNATQIEWLVANPRFNVDTSNNGVWGHEWEPDSSVTIDVQGVSIDLSTDVDGNFDMATSDDIIAGDTVTVSQGATTKSHVITQLGITAIDPDADIVSGVATPGSELNIWVHNVDNVWRHEIVAPDGTWSADFGISGDEQDEEGTTDLIPGSNGNSAQCDIDNDCTFASWGIPNPKFSVRLTEGEVHGYEWPLGESVTLTINDPATPDDPDYEDSQITIVSDWDPEQTFVGFVYEDIIEVGEGFVVTLTDGATFKQHTVTSLMIESVDVDADLVSGMAEPHTEISVAACNDYIADCMHRDEIADELGNWTANFSVPGDEDWEQDTFDIHPNTGGEARQRDNDGNETQLGWWLTDPLTCNPGESVMGVVYDSDGTTPISDATIYFEDFHSGEQLFQVSSGEEGIFGCALPDGDYRIWARGGGYSRQYYDRSIRENANLVHVISGLPISGVDFILNTPNAVIGHLTFNLSNTIVGELAVRQAIAYGTDRTSIIAATFPASLIWDTYLPPNHWAHATSGVPQYDFNPQDSRDTLTAAGWVDEDNDGIREKNGERLHIEYVTTDSPQRAIISQIITANMADIGIEIEVIAIPSPWDRIFTDHDFGIAQFAWGIDYNDEHSGNSLWYVFETNSSSNSGLYSNPTSDQLLANTLAVTTRAEKLIYLEQHQVLVMSDLAMLPLIDRSITNAPPDADIGGPYQTNEGEVISLDASLSTDPENNIVTYEWDLDNDGEYDDGTGVTVDFTFWDDGDYPVSLRVTDLYDETDTDSIIVTVFNLAPVVTIDITSQAVQYSDYIDQVTFTGTDVLGDAMSYTMTGAPAGPAVSLQECSIDGNYHTCTWILSGAVSGQAGSYNVAIDIEDDLPDSNSVQTAIVVEQEDALIEFEKENPVAVQVDTPGGVSPTFNLVFYTSEAVPDFALYGTAPGDISRASLSVLLEPVGPGTPVSGTCTPLTPTGSGYEGVQPFTCEFSHAAVNTYTVNVSVNGGYYTGHNEDVVVVFDPSLGFTTGGGWLYWPGTTERTNFGYTMKYNKKGERVKGNLLLIRHLADGSIFRIKSNALYGLALGKGDDIGWASFSGKTTYLEPGWVEPIGNHEFLVYVEDRDQSGSSLDKFWIEMHDKDGKLIPIISIDRDAIDQAIEIQGGNIIVPH